MDICRILVIAVLSTTTLSSPISPGTNNSPLKNNSQNIVCQPGEFKVFKFPAVPEDLNEVCVKCECPSCKDFVGCTECPSDFFMIYQNGSFTDRSYTVCLQCDPQCYSGSCQDRKGCLKCNFGYQIEKKVEKYNDIQTCSVPGSSSESFSSAYPEPTPVKKSNIFGLVLLCAIFLIIIIVVTLIVLSIQNKRRIKNANYGHPPQHASIDYHQQQAYH